MADIGKISFSVDTSGLKQGEQALDSFNQKQKQVTQGAKELNTAQQGLAAPLQSASRAQTDFGNSATATGRAFSGLQGVLTGINVAYGSNASNAAKVTTAAKELSGAHDTAREATMRFRETVHTLDPILISAGASMGNLGAFAMAARAGIIGLGIAIVGGFIAAVESSADKIKKFKDELADLYQSAPQGAKSFSALSQSAKQTGVDFAEQEKAARGLAIALREFQTIRFVAPSGQDIPEQLGIGQGAVDKAINNLAKLSAAGQSDFTALSGAFVEVAKSGTLTADGFKKIEDASQKTGNAIAHAFGFSGAQGVQTFIDSLKQSPRPIQQLITALVGLGETADNEFGKLNASGGTISMQLGRLKESWQSFVDSLSNAGIFSAVTRLIDFLTASVNKLAQAINFARSALGDSVVNGGMSGALGGAAAGAGIGFAVGGPVGALAGAGIGAVAGGIAGGATGAATDLSGSQASFQDNSSGQSFNVVPSDVQFFANGGLATVTGNGGTDSQLVQFMATPGEVVAVGNPTSSSGSSNASLQNYINQTNQNGSSQVVQSIDGSKTTIAAAVQKMNNNLASLLARISTQQQQTATAATATAAVATTQAATSATSGGITPGSFLQAIGDLAKANERLGYTARPNYPAGNSSSSGGGGYYYGGKGGGGPLPTSGYSPPPGSYDPLGSYVQSAGSGAAVSSDTSSTYSPFSSYSSDVFNSSYYAQSSGDQMSSTFLPAPYSDAYGSMDTGYYASGGSFTVGAYNNRSGTDSQYIGMHVTPGEKVSVTNAAQSNDNSIRIGSSNVIKLQLETPGQRPIVFRASRAQLARAMR